MNDLYVRDVFPWLVPSLCSSFSYLRNRNAARSPKVNMRYLSCHRMEGRSRGSIKKNEKDYRNVARKLNTEKLEEKLMRIAIGDVTVNTNGHAQPFLCCRLREEGRIDDVRMTGKHFPVTEDIVRTVIFVKNF